MIINIYSSTPCKIHYLAFIPSNISVYFYTKTCIALLRNWFYSKWFSLIWFPVQHIERREILICCNIYSFSCSQVTRLVSLVLSLQRYAQWVHPRCLLFLVCVCVCEREQTTLKKKKAEDLDKSNKPTNSTLKTSLQTSLAYFGECSSHQGSLNLLSFFCSEVYILLYTQKVTLWGARYVN